MHRTIAPVLSLAVVTGCMCYHIEKENADETFVNWALDAQRKMRDTAKAMGDTALAETQQIFIDSIKECKERGDYSGLIDLVEEKAFKGKAETQQAQMDEVLDKIINSSPPAANA